jgi:GWxTD domain-containing protein
LHIYILPSERDTVLSDPSALATRAIISAKRDILVSTAWGIPISVGNLADDADLDHAIEQLGVIATGAEWDSLSSAHTPEQKRNAILDFWRKKNPSRMSPHAANENENPAMEVFYSRVEYANSHFGTTFQAGWKSDRGHVYIALGPPDMIDSHPEASMRQAYGGLQKPYEIWQYSGSNLRYTFVDEYMLGDYRLHGAPPQEGTFIWE